MSAAPVRATAAAKLGGACPLQAGLAVADAVTEQGSLRQWG